MANQSLRDNKNSYKQLSKIILATVVCTALFIGCDDTTSIKYGEITSKITKKVWLDKNLGASRACESIDDKKCYGDYYQWGRNTDGHEKRDTAIISNISSSVNPNHSSFILGENSITQDWTQKDLEGHIRSSNWNPCPTNYRLPTTKEIQAEAIVNSKDAYEKLKLPSAGYRNGNNGSIELEKSEGSLWTSSISEPYSNNMIFDEKSAGIYASDRSNGKTIRCIKIDKKK